MNKVLHTFEHKGVKLIVWIENNELLWAYKTIDEPDEWLDWSNSYLSRKDNDSMEKMWEETK